MVKNVISSLQLHLGDVSLINHSCLGFPASPSFSFWSTSPSWVFFLSTSPSWVVFHPYKVWAGPWAGPYESQTMLNAVQIGALVVVAHILEYFQRGLIKYFTK